MSGIVFEQDFNSGSDITQMGFKYSGNENLEFVEINGERAIKLTLSHYEDDISYRTEIQTNKLPSSDFDNGQFAHMGKEYWYSVKMLLPEDWQFDSKQEVLLQWHGIPDSGEDWRNPPLALRIGTGDAGEGRSYLITQKADSRAIMEDKNYEFAKTTDVGSIVDDLGQWVTWTVHVKWSHQDDGFVEVFKNGEIVYQQLDHMNTYNDERGPYFKMGIYKSAWNGSGDTGADYREVYYDDLKIGNSEATLADLVTGGSTQPPANTAPDATDGYYNGVSEDGPAKEYAYDASDSDGDQLTFKITQQPPEGKVVDNGDGTFTFHPDGGFQYLAEGQSKTVEFKYEVSDGKGGKDTAVATVLIIGANDAPVASAVSVSGEGALTGQLQASDVDNGADLTFSLVGGGSGEVHVSDFMNGSGEVQPEGGVAWNGFAYSGWSGGGKIYASAKTNGVVASIQAEDGGLFSFLQADSLSSGGGAIDAELVGYRDGAKVGSVSFSTLANKEGATFDFGDALVNVDHIDVVRTGGDGQYLYFENAHTSTGSSGSGAEHGTVELNADGSFTYTPDAGFAGNDSFTYRVTDEHGASDTATVNVEVEGAPVNAAPVASNAFHNGVTEDGSPETMAYDAIDEDGDALSFTILSQPEGGQVTDNGDGTFTFDPGSAFQALGAGEHKDVQFTYEVTDGRGGKDTATDTVRFFGSNDDPTARDDTFEGLEDEAVTGNVLANNGSGSDADVDANDTLSVKAGTYSTWQGGRVVLNADGSFTYTGAQDFNGDDGFSYEVTDGNGGSDTATVTFEVRPVNDAPVARDDAFSGDEDGSVDGNLLADNGNGSDSDPDGDSLSVVSGTYATQGGGSVAIDTNGAFVYRPAANFSGSDNFQYTVKDSAGLTAIATASIAVQGVNDAPVALTDWVQGHGEITGRLNASDADGQTLNFELIGGESQSDVHVSNFVDSGGEVQPDGGIAWHGFDYSGWSGGGKIFASAKANGVAASIQAEDGGIFSLYQFNSLSIGNGSGVLDIELVGYRDGAAVGSVSFSTLADKADATFDFGDALINVDRIEVVRTGGEGKYLLLEDAHTSTGEVSGGTGNGTVEISADGNFIYTPDADFSGSDSFAYKVTDTSGASATKTVNVNVLDSSVETEVAAMGSGMNVVGSDEDDHLSGGIGDDTLTGGLGNDVFFFDADSGNDTVTDFKENGGADKLDLSSLGLSATDLSVTFDGSGAIIGLDNGDSIRLLGLQEENLDQSTDILI